MPNRILRDWRDSLRVNALSFGAEVFFTRLIMAVDDYGLYHAQGQLLKGSLFPLRDDVSIRDLYGWLEECATQGLIQFYVSKGRDYLQITEFRQRLRIMRSKYPMPDVGQMSAICPPSARHLPAICPLETETEVETETEEETETETISKQIIAAPIGASVSLWPTFDDFWNAYGKKVDRSKCEAVFKKIKQGGREAIMEHLRNYIPATPDIQFRKNPLTYLRNQSWNDAVIFKHGKQDNLTETLLASIADRARRDHER